MSKYRMIIGGAITSLLLIIACGGSDVPAPKIRASDFLRDKIEMTGAERKSEIRIYIGESLFEYIDGGAEIYHTYDFAEVATGDYIHNETEVVVDIYRFNSADDAYGLYSVIRPEDPNIVSLGVEGFVTASSLDFVKGDILVRLVGFDNSAETMSTIKSMAGYFAGVVPGTKKRPEMFSIFPNDFALRSTDKKTAKSFLGRLSLTDVYSQQYRLDGDTVMLFVMNDSAGDKFGDWSQQAANAAGGEISRLSLSDGTAAFIEPNSFYGQIMVARKKGLIYGMVNYGENHKEFIVDWLNSVN